MSEYFKWYETFRKVAYKKGSKYDHVYSLRLYLWNIFSMIKNRGLRLVYKIEIYVYLYLYINLYIKLKRPFGGHFKMVTIHFGMVNGEGLVYSNLNFLNNQVLLPLTILKWAAIILMCPPSTLKWPVVEGLRIIKSSTTDHFKVAGDYFEVATFKVEGLKIIKAWGDGES